MAFPNNDSPLTLHKCRLELEYCLVQGLDDSEEANEVYRIELAVEYLRHNINAADPVTKLCEYLQISPATLLRLFKSRLGQSPQAYALEMRMRQARERLSSGEKMALMPVERIPPKSIGRTPDS